MSSAVKEPKKPNAELIGNTEIDPIVRTIRKVWKTATDTRLALGEQFSKLRKATEPYKKDSDTGLTYNSAVAATGVSRGTAERYREMYETVTASGIPADVFIALSENGCNLAAKRGTTVAGILYSIPSLKSLDITDEGAVKAAAKKVNDDYPVNKTPASTPIDTLNELLANIQKMPQSSATAKMMADTQSAITKAKKDVLVTLATALAPFIGKDSAWAESYVKEVDDNATLLAQRYAEAVKFAKSATFLLESK